MLRPVLFGMLGLAALILLPAAASAQPGGGRFGGFGGGAGGGLMLLNDENVQKDLEIVDSQKEKLQAVQEKIREEFRTMFQGGERPDREAIQAKMEGFQKEVNDVLLPHQRDRLKQIEVQSRLRFGGNASIGDVLELSDEEKEKLREKDRELSTEMNKEISKIRDKYREKLLETLSPDQRAKFKQLMGNPIEFGQPQFGGGRGQGGQGRRGGGDRDRSN